MLDIPFYRCYIMQAASSGGGSEENTGPNRSKKFFRKMKKVLDKRFILWYSVQAVVKGSGKHLEN